MRRVLLGGPHVASCILPSRSPPALPRDARHFRPGEFTFYQLSPNFRLRLTGHRSRSSPKARKSAGQTDDRNGQVLAFIHINRRLHVSSRQ